MIPRRRILGAATVLGLNPWRGRVFAEDRTLPIVEGIGRILESARTGGRRLPGMIGAVVRGGELAAIGATGLRRVGSPEPIRPDDRVHLGSCTKAMTATLIGTLVEQGKLDWGTSLSDAFPARSAKMHPDFRGVTLRQLLVHRAGLPHDVPWWTLGVGLSVVEKRKELLTEALSGPPLSRAGTKFEYSNVGYVLAGLMAEEATGLAWEDLMRRRLFEPLGMSTAGFGPPGRLGGTDQPWGHRPKGDELRPVRIDNPPVMGPAGTVHCSIPDWAKFASVHLGTGPAGRRLLKDETLRALHTPAEGEDYAGGWMTLDRSWAGGRILTHGGSNTTWYASICIAPAKDLAVLVSVNAGGPPAERAAREAVSELIRWAQPDIPPAP